MRDEHTETAAAFAVSHGGRIQASTKRGTCKHCGRFGHGEANCYEVIGYPPRWASRVLESLHFPCIPCSWLLAILDM